MDRTPGTLPSFARRQKASPARWRRGIGLVFGGGCVGLMGHLANAMLAAGGHAIGVIPDALVAREIAHRGLPDLRVVHSMRERRSGRFATRQGGTG